MCRRAEQRPPFVSSRARGCHAKAGFFGEVQTRTGDACGWRKISVGPECETGPGSAGPGNRLWGGGESPLVSRAEQGLPAAPAAEERTAGLYREVPAPADVVGGT